MPFLLNGGALIASLTFLGHIWSAAAQKPARGGMITALLFWAAGLVLAGAATHYGYLSQHNFLKALRRSADGREDQAEQHRTQAEVQRDAWKGCVWGSLLAFGLGCGIAIWSLA